MIIPIKKIKFYTIGLLSLATLSLSSCKKEGADAHLGAHLPEVSFSATPLDANPNKMVVKSTTKDAFIWNWDLGNGETSDKETDTVLYSKKGSYTIKLVAFNSAGRDSVSKTIDIAKDVVSTGKNLVKGGDLTKASEEDWKILNTGGSDHTTIDFTDDGVVFSTPDGSGNGAIYQALQVKKGVKYVFSAQVKGDGMSDSWFEVYLDPGKPEDGQDYGDPHNKFVSLNTWSGCGTDAFDGDLAEIGCDGSGTGADGEITFSASGTIYLVIKAGTSGNLGTITMSDISLTEKE